MNGAAVYLSNPSLIIIKDCHFFNNSGFGGSSIYYSEIQNDFIIILKNNTFEKNWAKFGSAGIYFKEKYDQLFPYEANHFDSNFGANLESPPFQMQLNNSKLDFKRNVYQLSLIPGSNFNLIFSLIDYYGNYISYFNGGSVNREISGSDFSQINAKNIIIDGNSIASSSQGLFIEIQINN